VLIAHLEVLVSSWSYQTIGPYMYAYTPIPSHRLSLYDLIIGWLVM
jgi:hypothetical protein